MAARSKACVCDFSLAGIAGSNPAGGMDIHLCDCCVLSGSGLCDGPITGPEESYRVWNYLSVVTKSRQGGDLGPLGLSGHKNSSIWT